MQNDVLVQGVSVKGLNMMSLHNGYLWRHGRGVRGVPGTEESASQSITPNKSCLKNTFFLELNSRWML